MPSQSESHSTSTFQSFSSSSFSSTINGRTTSHSETTFSSPSGTKIHRTSQAPGQAEREERIEYDNAGRRIEGAGAGEGAGANERGRITDVSDLTEEEAEEMLKKDGKAVDRLAQRDAEYEERMEDEYAKRDGGA